VEVAQRNGALLHHCAELDSALQGHHHGDLLAQMRHSADVLLPLMGAVREAADALEALVDDDLWPMPTYQEMLFMR